MISLIVAISVAGSTEQAVSAAWARIWHRVRGEGAEADRLDLGAGGGGRVEERLHVVVGRRERVGGEEDAVGDLAGTPHHRGVERVGTDDGHVAEPGRVHLLEQRRDLRHHHRREQRLRCRIEARHLVDLRREVLVGEAEREVLDERAAGLLERLGEVLGVAREVHVVGRRERDGRRQALVDRELGGRGRLHRIAEAGEERASRRDPRAEGRSTPCR